MLGKWETKLVFMKSVEQIISLLSSQDKEDKIWTFVGFFYENKVSFKADSTDQIMMKVQKRKKILF